jgi:hypothetical protein
MRLGLEIGTMSADDQGKIRKPVKRNLTQKHYFNYINSLALNDLIKDRLKTLAGQYPSSSLEHILNNIHYHIARIEDEIKQEIANEEKARLLDLANTTVEITPCDIVEIAPMDITLIDTTSTTTVVVDDVSVNTVDVDIIPMEN